MVDVYIKILTASCSLWKWLNDLDGDSDRVSNALDMVNKAKTKIQLEGEIYKE